MLELTDVHAGYGHTPVLRGVSLAARPGAVTALLGRNGMGKTTTIRSVVGLVKANAGSIRLDGTELRGMPIHKRAKLGIGFVPETRQVFPSLTVTEHLKVGARRSNDGEDAWPIERLVELFPVLQRRASAKGGQLSGGEQQLLVIARALTTNPKSSPAARRTDRRSRPVDRERDRRHDPSAQSGGRCAGDRTGGAEPELRLLTLADHAYVLVKGEVAFDGASSTLAADADLQHALIGLGSV